MLLSIYQLLNWIVLVGEFNVGEWPPPELPLSFLQDLRLPTSVWLVDSENITFDWALQDINNSITVWIIKNHIINIDTRYTRHKTNNITFRPNWLNSETKGGRSRANGHSTGQIVALMVTNYANDVEARNRADTFDHHCKAEFETRMT